MIDSLLGERDPDESQIYWPVLRAKTSERKALAALIPRVRLQLVPILEFVPEWRGPGAGGGQSRSRAARTPAEYVQRMLDAAAASTPAGTRSLAYFGHAGPTAGWNGIDLFLAFEAHLPAACGVLPLVDYSSLGSLGSLARAVRHAGGALGVRIRTSDLGPATDAHLAQALRTLGIDEAATHLIVDLQADPGAASHSLVRASFRDIRAFASVVVLAGVFPHDLTQYQPGVHPERRLEWETWRAERAATRMGERRLAYGDYTTQCAYYRPSPALPGSVSLRYTTDDAILVFRGRQANGGAGLGYEQIHGHARLLVGRADYDGAAFSAGDQRIHCWTDPTKGPGNPEQWRTVSLVHHMTHVVAQLQDAAGSTATVRAWARAQAPAACT